MIAEAAPKNLPGSWLATWLRYDESRVEEVEAAYTDFLRRAMYGWWILAAVVLSFVVAIVFALIHRGEPVARMTSEMLPYFLTTFYGVQVLPILIVPRSTLATMLRGCVDVPRAILLGVGLGVVAVAIELLALTLLMTTKLTRPATPDFFSGSVIFGTVVLTIAAPLVEEFQMQAWLQSRLRPLGGFWAGVLTTIVFILMHVPKTAFELVRVATLGFAALLRGTTRSLAASIAVHLTNNTILALLLLVARAYSQHGAHLSHGSHR